jgi:hypothetical protein
MANYLRACEHLARHYIGPRLAVTCGNALPPFTGGQAVAGSNPVKPDTVKPDTVSPTLSARPISPTDVSPTKEKASELRKRVLKRFM